MTIFNGVVSRLNRSFASHHSVGPGGLDADLPRSGRPAAWPSAPQVGQRRRP